MIKISIFFFAFLCDKHTVSNQIETLKAPQQFNLGNWTLSNLVGEMLEAESKVTTFWL